MGCNCKGNKKDGSVDSPRPKVALGKSISMYILKTLGFLVMVALLPIINLVIIWFLFRTLILNRDVDMKPLLMAIGKKFQPKEDDDDDDYDDLTEEDVVMVDVEDITKKSK
jgi:hypothetical protein